MAGSMLVLVALIALGALTTFISLSMLWATCGTGCISAAPGAKESAWIYPHRKMPDAPVCSPK